MMKRSTRVDAQTVRWTVVAVSFVAYVASFFLPVVGDASYADEVESATFLGAETFIFGLLLGPFAWPAWVSNFTLLITWIAYLIPMPRAALVLALSTVLLALSSLYVLLSVEAPLRFGYFLWLFASALMAVATVGEGWMARRQPRPSSS